MPAINSNVGACHPCTTRCQQEDSGSLEVLWRTETIKHSTPHPRLVYLRLLVQKHVGHGSTNIARR
jgi:hypothetical protein